MTEMGNKKTISLCSHSYCAPCIVSFIRSKNSQQIKCPYCRRAVTFIVMTNEEGIGPADVEFLRSYNMRFSGERTFADCIMDAPFLVKRFLREIFTTDITVLVRNYRLILMIFTGVVYVLSPFDLIPEMIFGVLGFIDDLVIIVFIFIAVAQGFR